MKPTKPYLIQVLSDYTKIEAFIINIYLSLYEASIHNYEFINFSMLT